MRTVALACRSKSRQLILGRPSLGTPRIIEILLRGYRLVSASESSGLSCRGDTLEPGRMSRMGHRSGHSLKVMPGNFSAVVGSNLRGLPHPRVEPILLTIEVYSPLKFYVQW
jgi:hypothetical protein